MIDNIFGLSIRYKPWDKKSILPLYIVSNYQFYTAYKSIGISVLEVASRITLASAVE